MVCAILISPVKYECDRCKEHRSDNAPYSCLHIAVDSRLDDSEEIREREFSVLELIPDNYPKYVLSMDEVDFSRNGIRHCRIEDFLLSALSPQ